MPVLELVFPLIAAHPIPSDHGYLLYSAISQLIPELHNDNSLAIQPIRGQQIGNRQIQLTEKSRLAVRVPDGEITSLLKLAGKSLRIGASSIRVGVPQVLGLTPATSLRSRLVTIKVKDVPAATLTPELFLAAARRALNKLGVSPDADITIPTRHSNSPEATTIPQRRTLRVHDVEIVGYELIIHGLTAEESITVQEQGLGGKRHMGCGVFVAFGENQVTHAP